MTDPICYMDGKYAPLSKLRIAPNDLGVLRGYGAFDFLRTFNGKPFMLNEHVARFQRSAKRMGLTIPPAAKLKEIAHELIRRNAFSETAIKFVITGGPSEDGVTLADRPTFYVLATPTSLPPRERYTKGVHLRTYEYMRVLPETKTLNYLVSVQKQKELARAGVLELLYVYDGAVLECSSSNIFLVKRNVLVTPKTDILPGTTKLLIKQLAKGKYKIEERRVSVKELKTADEVFITASNKAVMPVVKIDTFKIGSGKVGPVSQDLLARFNKKVGIV